MEYLSAIRTANGAFRPSARCERSKAQSVKKRTRRADRNGFLSHRFLPFWQYSGNRERAEREFQNSLSNICAYYGLTTPAVAGAFPQYIHQVQQEVIERLKAVDNKLSCIIAEDDGHTATIATVKRYDTGMTLYYIPVRPLWQWMDSGVCSEITELLICLFAYLEQVVRIPFYTEEGSYLSYQYQILEDWVHDDQEDDEHQQVQLDTLYTLQNAGQKIHLQILKPENLHRFEHVVTQFNPSEDWLQDWHRLANEFLSLYKQYPKRSVFDHIHPDLLYPTDEDRIGAEQYISFYWSGNDCFQDTLFEMINNHFQEIAFMDEPSQVQLFDHFPETILPDFDFEKRLFELINQLSQILNKYDHEKCEPPIQ